MESEFLTKAAHKIRATSWLLSHLITTRYTRVFRKKRNFTLKEIALAKEQRKRGAPSQRHIDDLKKKLEAPYDLASKNYRQNLTADELKDL